MSASGKILAAVSLLMAAQIARAADFVTHELWSDAVAEQPAQNERANALGTARYFDTGVVPTGGAFTASALLRVDGFAPMPEKMEWRNGMVMCCGSGYYDGFRIILSDDREMRPSFGIGRAEGAAAIESPIGLATGIWHHIAASWAPSADSATNGVARLYINGSLVAESPEHYPAPILKGEPLRLGYVDFGVGAIRGAVARPRWFPCALPADEIVETFISDAKLAPEGSMLRAAGIVRAAAGEKRKDSPKIILNEVRSAIPANAIDGDLVRSVSNKVESATRGLNIVHFDTCFEDRPCIYVDTIGPEDCGDDAAQAIARRIAHLARERKAGESDSKLMLRFRPGIYRFRSTLTIQGSAFDYLDIIADEPVASLNCNVFFDGGMDISSDFFEKIADDAILARLPSDDARRDVVCAPLPEDFILKPKAHGCGVKGPRHGLLLDADGTNALRMARWPNSGYIRADATNSTFKFKAEHNAPALADGSQVLAHGYWMHDWADTAVPAEAVKDGVIRTLETPGYGIRAEPRLALMNAIEFLDEPGEWCAEGDKLYIYPPKEGFSFIGIPVMEGPLIRIEDAKRVLLEDIEMRHVAGDALVARRTPLLSLNLLTFRDIGGCAADIETCPGSQIALCDFIRTGHGGLRLANGDRATLTPNYNDENYAKNDTVDASFCSFTDIAVLARTYTPAVQMEGVNVRLSGCSFSDMPSSAIRVEGNDHVICNCRFDRCVLESDDQGAIDLWGDPTYRGNMFCGNTFEDIGPAGGGAGECGRAAIRLDDLISGNIIYENIFRRASQGNFGAVQIHGGQHNIVACNYFADCSAGVSFDAWGGERWLEKLDDPEIAAKLEGREKSPVYLERYPDFAHLRGQPDLNAVAANVFSNTVPFLRKKSVVRDYWNALLPAASPSR